MMIWSRSGRDCKGGDSRGFTLVELMIALVVLGVLLGAIYQVFTSQEKLFKQQEQAAEMQENLRATTEFLNQEMSWMGYKVGTVAVAYATSTELIYRANTPYTGATVSWIRYRFNTTDNTIERAVGGTTSDVLPLTNEANLKVLASDIQDLAFTYYNVDGNTISICDTDAPPSCTRAIGSVSPLNGPHDSTLRTIQRIRTSVVVRTARPDYTYTHPVYGVNHRTREGIIDVKPRNLEDVTFAGAGVGTGDCSSLSITVTGGSYNVCPDYNEFMANGFLAPASVTDNPQITVAISDPLGNPDTTHEATVFADRGIQIYDGTAAQDNLILTGETLYVGANELSEVTEGMTVTLTAGFRNPDEVGCLQVNETATLTLASGGASRFDTTAPYDGGPVVAEYVDLTTGLALDPQPSNLAACPSVGNAGMKLTVRLEDDCDNGIEGETVEFTALKGSFQSGTQDNGDGTYSIIYIPPDSIALGAEFDSDTITATWVAGSLTETYAVTLRPNLPDHMVINDITSASPYGFAKTGADSFEIQRVYDQLVTMDVSVLDQCGNRVFGEETAPLTGTATYGSPSMTALAGTNGRYLLDWASSRQCGEAVTGQTITIEDPRITSATGTPPPHATVTFDMLETPSSVFVLAYDIGTGSFSGGIPDADLKAGGNGPYCADNVTINAWMIDYDGGTVCQALTDPYDVNFTVRGLSAGLGNGSFKPAVADTAEGPVSATPSGTASVTLYPGDARWGQTLEVKATAVIAGAPTDPSTITVDVTETSQDTILSGMYDSDAFDNRVVNLLTNLDRSFDPGDSIYPRVVDCDENVVTTAVEPFDPVDPFLKAKLASLVTGDVVTVNLSGSENGVNTADFRYLPGVPTELNAVADTSDSTLQVASGDEVTLSYFDKEDPASSALSWTTSAFIAGPRSLELRRLDGTTIALMESDGSKAVSGAPLANGDGYRVLLYYPEFSGDAVTVDFMTDTVQAEADDNLSTDETDTFTVRENGNTGVFLTDPVKYTADYNVASKAANPPSPDDERWLSFPFTPERVTVAYPDLASPIFTASFKIIDEDQPATTIQNPTDGSSVSGIVPIDIFAEDVNNFFPGAGIDRVDYWVDGQYQTSAYDPAGLAMPVSFPWTTAYGGTILYLNGQHTILARSRDLAGNYRVSAVTTVTVANPGATDITIIQPADNTVWNQSVTVVLEAPELIDVPYYDYTCSLSLGAFAQPDVSMDPVGNACTWNVDLTSVPDNTYILTATVTDRFGNSDPAVNTKPIIVDHTPPTLTFGPRQPWYADVFPMDLPHVFAVDLNGVDSSSVYADLTGDCGPVSGLPMTNIGLDEYQHLWAGPCPGVEGSVFITAYASDQVLDIVNQGSSSTTINVDTKHPVMGAIGALPSDGPHAMPFDTAGPPIPTTFVRGDVLLDSAVIDGYPSSAQMIFNYLGLPSWGYLPFTVAYGLPLDDPVSGAFHYSWNTTGFYNGIDPWLSGPYVVEVHGTDMAGNADTGTTLSVVWVDNNPPYSDPPDMIWSRQPARDKVNLNFYADDSTGFLKFVEHRIVDSGADPLTAPLRFSGVQNYPATDMVTSDTGSYTWDVSALSDGFYDGHAYAEDWAGNTFDTLTGGWTSFIEVYNKYLLPASGTFSAVSGTAFGTTVYTLEVAGTVTSPSGPVNNEPVRLEVVKLDPMGNPLWPSYIDTTSSTVGSGKFTVNVPELAMVFFPGDRVRVDVFSDMNNASFGYLIGDAPVPLAQRPFVRLLDLYPQMNPDGLGNYNLTVSGNLNADFIGPVDGEDVLLYVEQSGAFGWTTRTYTVPVAGGAFSFTVPDLTYGADDWYYFRVQDPTDPALFFPNTSIYGEAGGDVVGFSWTWF